MELGSLNTNRGPEPVNTNWGLGLVYKNWEPGPGTNQRAVCREKQKPTRNRVLLNSVQEWLVGCFWLLICLRNQLSSIIHSITRIKRDVCKTCLKVQIFEKRVHQIDSKNEWLLLPASFTAKFRLVFVWTLENSFS